MTREEAIHELQEDKSLYETEVCHAGDGSPDGRLLEAIDMAIEALKGGDAKMNEIKNPYYMQQTPSEDGSDLISRADAIEAVRGLSVLVDDKDFPYFENALKALPSADAVSSYAEWLEKIIVDNEGANEWLCEDTADLEWCEKNCHYSSIQAECLRHLYEVSKGGDTE